MRLTGKHQVKSKTVLIAVLVSAGLLITGPVYAQQVVSLAQIAQNIMGSFVGLGKLLIAIAYLAGVGFTIASIFKFKQHKDNPTQIPLGTPLALLTLGVVLVFLPGIFRPVGETIYGASYSDSMAGGPSGSGAPSIPGDWGSSP